MNYTPFGHLTDNELIREVVTKTDPTDLELELMHRLEYWMEYAETLMEESAKYAHGLVKPNTKHVEAAL